MSNSPTSSLNEAAGAPPPLQAREVEEHAQGFERLRAAVRLQIVGQDQVVEEILTAVLAEGHCLIVGVPGLAKTLIVSTIAELLSLRFKRIQFTPDLMPSDITGATIIAHETEAVDRGYQFLRGPIFANILLADEVNRTPPKTQAALMEAMEERQVTAGGKRIPLDRPFFVLATQNPIEQEGTYLLPVSQIDRFMFNVLIDYPTAEEEFKIVSLTTSAYRATLAPVLDQAAMLRAIQAARRVSIDTALVDYATRLVRMSRPADPLSPPYVRECLAWGGGPRAIQGLILGAKAYALQHGRAAVKREDIHRLFAPTLRHRLVLSYHAEAEGIEPDAVVSRILEHATGRPREEPAAPARPGLLKRLLKGRRS